MNDILRDVNGLDAATALDASKVAFATMLGSLPGATLHVEPDLVWLDTGVPDSVFNGVYQSRLSGRELASTVARVRSHFQRRRLPFHWEVGLRAEPSDVGEILVQASMRHDEDEPGMWLDLRTLPDGEHPVAGLSIQPVTDGELLRQWMWVSACGGPEEAIDRWYRVYSALPFGPDGSLRMFVGYLHGKPAATAYLFLAAGVATVHYVVTRHEFRGQGIGTAMTRMVVKEARDAGYRVAVLTASPFGINIYRRMGFQQCCVVSTYDWHPDNACHTR